VVDFDRPVSGLFSLSALGKISAMTADFDPTRTKLNRIRTLTLGCEHTHSYKEHGWHDWKIENGLRYNEKMRLTKRCSEPDGSVVLAVVASRAPGR
jgi:hypothetical protein